MPTWLFLHFILRLWITIYFNCLSLTLVLLGKEEGTCLLLPSKGLFCGRPASVDTWWEASSLRLDECNFQHHIIISTDITVETTSSSPPSFFGWWRKYQLFLRLPLTLLQQGRGGRSPSFWMGVELQTVTWPPVTLGKKGDSLLVTGVSVPSYHVVFSDITLGGLLGSLL